MISYPTRILEANKIVNLWLFGAFKKLYGKCWTKSVGTPKAKEGRLDRVFVTQSWLDSFPHNRFINGVSDKSEQTPIWLSLNEWDRRVGHCEFKIENLWLKEPEFPLVVGESWRMSEGFDFLTKMKHCTTTVDAWGKKLRSRYVP